LLDDDGQIFPGHAHIDEEAAYYEADSKDSRDAGSKGRDGTERLLGQSIEPFRSVFGCFVSLIRPKFALFL
jgi:hypothetical protein